MTTIIPTIDDITGNTVMQKFRSLATLVLDFMTPLYESTEEVIALKPEIEQALSDVLEQKALVENLRQIVINNVQTVNSLMAEVNTALQSAVTIDGVQTIRGPKTFSANTIFTDVEIDNLITTIQAEIAGMAIEMSDLKTVLSNDNGISFPGLVSMANLDAIVPTTATGTRDTKAANGSRIQNDLDSYEYMVRTVNNQTLYGIKHNVSTSFGGVVYVGGNTARWVRICYSTTPNAPLIIDFMPDKPLSTNLICSGRLCLICREGSGEARVSKLFYEETNLANQIYCTFDGTKFEVWYHYPENTTNKRVTAFLKGGFYNRSWLIDGETSVTTLDPATYEIAIKPTVM